MKDCGVAALIGTLLSDVGPSRGGKPETMQEISCAHVWGDELQRLRDAGRGSDAGYVGIAG